MLDEKDFKIERRKTWECPDGTGVPLITMPNVPKPLHGIPPRVIMGQTTWDKVRKRCYYDAGYKCEICGVDFADIKPRYAAHELYTYDYEEGVGRFERCIAICAKCHDAIHSGRLITMYKQGNPLYPKAYVLGVVEHCFKLVHDYNKEHDEKLKLYNTFLRYLKVPELYGDMIKMIIKYDIEFYSEPLHCADWEKWKMVWCGKEFPTPYKSYNDWESAMEERSELDTKRIAAKTNPFKGDVFDVIKDILEGEEQ